MHPTVILNVVGLTPRAVGADMPRLGPPGPAGCNGRAHQGGLAGRDLHRHNPTT